MSPPWTASDGDGDAGAAGEPQAVRRVFDGQGFVAPGAEAHKSHHTMNAMGHQVRTAIGANVKSSASSIASCAKVQAKNPPGTVH